MGRRRLVIEWDGMAARVEQYERPLVLAAALVGSPEGWEPIAITLRGGTQLPPCEYAYEQPAGEIRLIRQPTDRVAAANVLLSGHFEWRGRQVRFPTPPWPGGSGGPTWVTQGSEWGVVAPTPTPRLCHEFSWRSAPPQPDAVDLDQPLVSRGSFYPSLLEGLMEVLYGRTTLNSTIHNLLHRLDISLAYDDAYLGDVGYVTDVGLVVDVREGQPGSAAGHALEVLWRLNADDTEFGRWSETVARGGLVTVPVEGPPAAFWVALLRNTELVDQVAGAARGAQVDETPLPHAALLEAFGFLDLAWRNLFHRPLLHNPTLAGAAGLTEPVTSQSDFSAQMSRLADLLKACRVDDDLLPQRKPGADETVRRVEAALRRRLPRLGEADREMVSGASTTLIAANRVRTALQHHVRGPRKSDLPAALADLGVDHPPDWGRAWEVVRRRVIDSLGQLRGVIRANLS